jgi:N-formylglutamate amidohydrolase
LIYNQIELFKYDTVLNFNKKGKKMLLHIPHSNTTIPSYEEQMAKDKDVLKAIEKYTDHRTSELFHYDGAERVEYGYSRLFCDVEKLEENEPMEALGLGILYEVSNASRKYPEKALATYRKHHKKLLETTKKQKEMFDKVGYYRRYIN